MNQEHTRLWSSPIRSQAGELTAPDFEATITMVSSANLNWHELLVTRFAGCGNSNDSRQNSQRIDKDFFSAIMRLDVDKLPGSLPPNAHTAATTNYAVPPDSPFIGVTNFNGATINSNDVRTEFWPVIRRQAATRLDSTPRS
jgi:hypothetical protein